MEPNWVSGDKPRDEACANCGPAARKALGREVHLFGEDAVVEIAIVSVVGRWRVAGVSGPADLANGAAVGRADICMGVHKERARDSRAPLFGERGRRRWRGVAKGGFC
jgi:hypothetical protein